MADVFDKALEAIDIAKIADAAADDAYEGARIKWVAVSTAYGAGFEMDEDTKDKLLGFIKTYGPKIAMFAGGPGIGAALAAGVADKGAFSRILSFLPSIF